MVDADESSNDPMSAENIKEHEPSAVKRDKNQEVQGILFNSPILFYSIIRTYRYLRVERCYIFHCPLKELYSY